MTPLALGVGGWLVGLAGVVEGCPNAGVGEEAVALSTWTLAQIVDGRSEISMVATLQDLSPSCRACTSSSRKRTLGKVEQRPSQFDVVIEVSFRVGISSPTTSAVRELSGLKVPVLQQPIERPTLGT
jgi:hypothetical protein